MPEGKEKRLIRRGLRIMSNITVYSKSSCVQCTATYRALDGKGVTYTVVDLEHEPVETVEQFKARGLMQAPIVITDTDEWAGFRPDKIAALAA
jgi:glutaredoxin-like protein NrdH